MICKKCGSNVPINSKFCMTCGTSVLENNSLNNTNTQETIDKPGIENNNQNILNNNMSCNLNNNSGNNNIIIPIIVLVVVGVAIFFGYKTVNNYFINNNKENNKKLSNDNKNVVNDYVMINEEKVNTIEKENPTIKRLSSEFTENGGKDITERIYSSQTLIKYNSITKDELKTYAEYLFKNGYNYLIPVNWKEIVILAKNNINDHQIYITIDIRPSSNDKNTILYQYICSSMEGKYIIIQIMN